MAAISLLLFVLHCVFQHRTHWPLYSINTGDDSDNEDWKPTILAPFSSIIVAVICTFMLYMCCNTLVLGLSGLEPAVRVLLAIFVIPVSCHAASFIDTVRLAFLNRSDHAITSTLNGTTSLLLFVHPIITLSSWIPGWIPYFGFELQQIVLMGIAFWVLAIVVSNGKANYLDGVLLICL